MTQLSASRALLLGVVVREAEQLEEALARDCTVPVLGTFCGAPDADAGREVVQKDSGLGPIDMLPSGAAASAGRPDEVRFRHSRGRGGGGLEQNHVCEPAFAAAAFVLGAGDPGMGADEVGERMSVDGRKRQRR